MTIFSSVFFFSVTWFFSRKFIETT